MNIGGKLDTNRKRHLLRSLANARDAFLGRKEKEGPAGLSADAEAEEIYDDFCQSHYAETPIV